MTIRKTIGTMAMVLHKYHMKIKVVMMIMKVKVMMLTPLLRN